MPGGGGKRLPNGLQGATCHDDGGGNMARMGGLHVMMRMGGAACHDEDGGATCHDGDGGLHVG